MVGETTVNAAKVVCARKLQGYVRFQFILSEILHILVIFLHTYIGQGNYKDT